MVASLSGLARHLAVATAAGATTTKLRLLFSLPVENVSLALLRTPAFQEGEAQILVSSSGLTFERSSRFVGDGSADDPFRIKGPGPANLRLSWRGPLTSVEVQLRQNMQEGLAPASLRVSDLVVRVAQAADDEAL